MLCLTPCLKAGACAKRSVKTCVCRRASSGTFIGLVHCNSLHTKAEYIEYLKSEIAKKENAIEPVWIEFSFNGFLYRTNGAMVQGKDGNTWNTTHSIPVVLAGREVWNAR